MAESTLSTPALEDVYDTLAVAIDAVGPDKAEIFLVKLALLQANALNDRGQFKQMVETALGDL